MFAFSHSELPEEAFLILGYYYSVRKSNYERGNEEFGKVIERTGVRRESARF